jgi:hypothetical protein
MYAGDMTVQQAGVIDLTNLSGTFQFDDEPGLLQVADQLQRQGLTVFPGAVRLFPSSGTSPRIVR